MLYKVFKSETSGYTHVRNQFESPITLQLMHIKLTIFTVFFSMICIENSFRVMDFWQEWSWPIMPKRPASIDFSSDYDITFSAAKRLKLSVRQAYAPLALA